MEQASGGRAASQSNRRAALASLAADASLVAGTAGDLLGIETLRCPAMVLNAQRQVVACNRALLESLGLTPHQAAGRRPGELLRCINAGLGDDGCGSADPCRTCGAVTAILGCQREGLPTSGRCRLTITVLGSRRCVDAEVSATPVDAGGRRFTLFSLRLLGGPPP